MSLVERESKLSDRVLCGRKIPWLVEQRRESFEGIDCFSQIVCITCVLLSRVLTECLVSKKLLRTGCTSPRYRLRLMLLIRPRSTEIYILP